MGFTTGYLLGTGSARTKTVEVEKPVPMDLKPGEAMARQGDAWIRLSAREVDNRWVAGEADSCHAQAGAKGSWADAALTLGGMVGGVVALFAASPALAIAAPVAGWFAGDAVQSLLDPDPKQLAEHRSACLDSAVSKLAEKRAREQEIDQARKNVPLPM